MACGSGILPCLLDRRIRLAVAAAAATGQQGGAEEPGGDLPPLAVGVCQPYAQDGVSQRLSSQLQRLQGDTWQGEGGWCVERTIAFVCSQQMVHTP